MPFNDRTKKRDKVGEKEYVIEMRYKTKWITIVDCRDDIHGLLHDPLLMQKNSTNAHFSYSFGKNIT